MAKWEYKVSSGLLDRMETAINQLAEKGWEVVSTTAYTLPNVVGAMNPSLGPGTDTHLTVILKREKSG